MNKASILQCAERIAPFIHRTPVLTSSSIDRLAACSIHFKCENFQRMGAFKMRGGMNALLSLSDEQKAKGVVTHSSGNFAQAVALGAKALGIEAHIVMPENAPLIKQKAVEGYGGIIHLCESTQAAREANARQIVQDKGCSFLHPYDMEPVIIGQATAAKELIEDFDKLDFILTPVGGGGLLAGTALSAHYFSPNIRVIGGEPFGADDAYRSLKKGELLENETVNTVADGLRTNLGQLTFPILKAHVAEIIRVEEQEIIDAMRLIWERMNIIVEASCAVPLAAILREPEQFKGAQVGVILTGGNVDLNKLPF